MFFDWEQVTTRFRVGPERWTSIGISELQDQHDRTNNVVESFQNHLKHVTLDHRSNLGTKRLVEHLAGVLAARYTEFKMLKSDRRLPQRPQLTASDFSALHQRTSLRLQQQQQPQQPQQQQQQQPPQQQTPNPVPVRPQTAAEELLIDLQEEGFVVEPNSGGGYCGDFALLRQTLGRTPTMPEVREFRRAAVRFVQDNTHLIALGVEVLIEGDGLPVRDQTEAGRLVAQAELDNNLHHWMISKL